METVMNPHSGEVFELTAQEKTNLTKLKGSQNTQRTFQNISTGGIR